MFTRSQGKKNLKKTRAHQTEYKVVVCAIFLVNIVLHSFFLSTLLLLTHNLTHLHSYTDSTRNTEETQACAARKYRSQLQCPGEEFPRR
mmetsp:Transcript_39642/g.78009  ORF Transcript_39642/g.78009 Transcript_39642/m.78009 type:complete len:89 (-) Transcript_39642:862-1128(-)